MKNKFLWRKVLTKYVKLNIYIYLKLIVYGCTCSLIEETMTIWTMHHVLFIPCSGVFLVKWECIVNMLVMGVTYIVLRDTLTHIVPHHNNTNHQSQHRTSQCALRMVRPSNRWSDIGNVFISASISSQQLLRITTWRTTLMGEESWKYKELVWEALNFTSKANYL